jgi:hypothetical protein
MARYVTVASVSHQPTIAPNVLTFLVFSLFSWGFLIYLSLRVATSGSK